MQKLGLPGRNPGKGHIVYGLWVMIISRHSPALFGQCPKIPSHKADSSIRQGGSYMGKGKAAGRGE